MAPGTTRLPLLYSPTWYFTMYIWLFLLPHRFAEPLVRRVWPHTAAALVTEMHDGASAQQPQLGTSAVIATVTSCSFPYSLSGFDGRTPWIALALFAPLSSDPHPC